MVDTARSPNPALSGLRGRLSARLRGGHAGREAESQEATGGSASGGESVASTDAIGSATDGSGAVEAPLSGMLELSDLGTFVPIEPAGDEWDADDDDPTIAMTGVPLGALPALIPAAIPFGVPSGAPVAHQTAEQATAERQTAEMQSGEQPTGEQPTGEPVEPADPILTPRRLALAAATVAAAALLVIGSLAATHSGPFATMRAENAAHALAEHLHDIAAPKTLGSKALTAPATKSWTAAFAHPAPAPQRRLPVPLPVPADPYEPANYADIGQIDIPKIGLSTPLHQGMTLSAIDKGPSYWPGTAHPGSLGNMVIAGHRVSHTAPFYRINELEPGDTMTVTLLSGTAYTYRVTGSEIVDPEELSIVGQRPAYEATIFACHPRGSARRRYVVHFELLGPDGQPIQLGDYRLVSE